jgi:cytochrome P450
LKPLIQERNDAEKQSDYESPNDTLEWVRNLLSDQEKKDYEYQAIQQLALGAAAIHTTSQLITNVIFDLCARPEYLPELREEVKAVLAKHGGEWTIDSMNELKKMDSFIKESQRCSPTVISFQRKVVKPLTLKDGTRIPKGAWLLAPAAAISHDPNVYEKPDQFDGFRYYKMRQVPDEENKHMFVSTGNTQLHFGGGRHACPGRWFASHEIKLIVSALITEYDMKTKNGVGRPKNILFQSQNSPDPTAEILFKSRPRN